MYVTPNARIKSSSPRPVNTRLPRGIAGSGSCTLGGLDHIFQGREDLTPFHLAEDRPFGGCFDCAVPYVFALRFS